MPPLSHANTLRALAATAATLSSAAFAVAAPASASADSFGYTGGVQTYVVPAGIDYLHVGATGAQGGTGFGPWHDEPGGVGAQVSSDIPVTPGQTVYVYVGGMGSFRSLSGGL